jgi:hypothetical protein
MNRVKNVSVLEGQVLSCAISGGAAKLHLQLSKRTEVVADGVEFAHPKAEKMNELKMIEISPKQLDPSLVQELRITRTGDKVRMNVLVDDEGGVTYTLFNITEYSVPMRL